MSLTSTQFLTIVDATQPNSVNIWYSEAPPGTPQSFPLTVFGFTIPIIDNNGTNSTQLLLSAQQINMTLNGYNYTFVIQSRVSRTVTFGGNNVTYYFFEITHVTINHLADNTPIILSQIIVAIPSTTSTIFFGGDYDVLLNNVQDNRQSTNVMVADRYEIKGGPGSVNPTNIDDILTLTARKANIQDSNYSMTGWINGRYEGTSTNSIKYGGLDSAITGKSFKGSYFPSSITTASINNQISSNTVLYNDYLSTSQDDLPSQPYVTQTRYVTNGTAIASSDNTITIQLLFGTTYPDIYIGDIITMGDGTNQTTFTEYIRVEDVQIALFNQNVIILDVTRKWNGSPSGQFAIPNTRALFKIPNLTKIYQLKGNKIQGISKGRLVVKESLDILTIDGFGQVVIV